MRTLAVIAIVTTVHGLAALAMLRGEVLGGGLAILVASATLPSALADWFGGKEEE